MQLEWDLKINANKKGVLTGCDENHEWMLKWWWTHYSQSNHFPVTFLDFGMSTSARLWCKRIGTVVPVTMDESAFYSREKLPTKTRKKWDACYAKTIWKSRKPWCLKPLGLLKTPYEYSAWIDLDCKVLKTIDPLIKACEGDVDIAIAKENSRGVSHYKKSNGILPGEVVYNAGVLSFQKHSPCILKWAKNMVSRNGDFLGDTEVLNRTLFEENFKVKKLSSSFNQSFVDGKKQDTHILHFVCSGGKHEIFRSLYS